MSGQSLGQHEWTILKGLPVNRVTWRSLAAPPAFASVAYPHRPPSGLVGSVPASQHALWRHEIRSLDRVRPIAPDSGAILSVLNTLLHREPVVCRVVCGDA
jgi:hypothetical protein